MTPATNRKFAEIPVHLGANRCVRNQAQAAALVTTSKFQDVRAVASSLDAPEADNTADGAAVHSRRAIARADGYLRNGNAESSNAAW